MSLLNNVFYACTCLLRSKLVPVYLNKANLRHRANMMESSNGTIPVDDQFTIFVEGNIGSGKTSFLNHFKNHEAMLCAEPMDLWRNLRGHNVLKLMYENPGRWSFTFQSLVQKTMLDLHLQSTKSPIKLMERSIFSARITARQLTIFHITHPLRERLHIMQKVSNSLRYCFVEHLHKQGLMSAPEYAVLDEWFKWITTKCKITGNLMVYLRTDPEVVHKRIIARGRKEESNLTLSYLQCLHELHEDWLMKMTAFSCPIPVIVLDANQSIPDILEQFKSLQPDLVDRMSMKRKLVKSTCSPSKRNQLIDSTPEKNILKTVH